MTRKEETERLHEAMRKIGSLYPTFDEARKSLEAFGRAASNALIRYKVRAMAQNTVNNLMRIHYHSEEQRQMCINEFTEEMRRMLEQINGAPITPKKQEDKNG